MNGGMKVVASLKQRVGEETKNQPAWKPINKLHQEENLGLKQSSLLSMSANDKLTDWLYVAIDLSPPKQVVASYPHIFVAPGLFDKKLGIDSFSSR